MSRATRELTTTSYAMLGLLAIRPWSTYELARQMRRNLHYFWPRAESNLYAEPLRLVSGGWAKARSLPVGRRPRTVYSITAKGRQALEHWLGEPAAAPRLEAEPLVKFTFADYGTKSSVLENLRRFRKDAETRQSEMRAIFDEYLRERDPFPERVHINVVAYRLLWDHADVDAHWAAWALDQVERWPDTKKPHSRSELMDVLREALKGQ
ncbi:MAG TPA: PadR family transcriptional regulator [Candidatus Dormibacteraeota bacterium]